MKNIDFFGIGPKSKKKPFKFRPVKLPTKKSVRKISKKNLTWPQAVKRYPKVTMFGDADRDGKLNMFDCKPFDKKRHSFRHKGKLYPDTVTHKRHAPMEKWDTAYWGAEANDRAGSKMNDKAAAYYNTLDKIAPGMTRYLKKTKTVVQVGPPEIAVKTNIVNRDALGSYDEGNKFNRRKINVDKFKKGKIASHVDVTVHEFAHLKRDVEMKKKGLEPFDGKGGWKYEINRKNDGEEKYKVIPLGYEIEAEKYKDRMRKRMYKEDIDPEEVFKKELKKLNKKEKPSKEYSENAKRERAERVLGKESLRIIEEDAAEVGEIPGEFDGFVEEIKGEPYEEY